MEKYFPRKTTAAVRAVAAIAIVFCHLTRTMPLKAGNPLLIFGQFGELAVGIFFFYTGYNLMFAFRKNPESWHRGFWRRKLLNVYLPFILANILFQCWYWVQKIGPYDIKQISFFALGGYLLNPDVWYVQGCMIVYVLSYLLLRFVVAVFKKETSRRIAAMAASLAVLLGYNFIYSRRGTYISSESLLPLTLTAGMLAACLSERGMEQWRKHRWCIALVIFLMLTYVEYVITCGSGEFRVLGTNIFDVLPTLLTVLIINTLLIGVELDSKFLAFVSSYSLYMYLTHSLLYQLWRSELVYIKSDVLYVLVYLASVCLMSFLLKKLTELIKNAVNKPKMKAGG